MRQSSVFRWALFWSLLVCAAAPTRTQQPTEKAPENPAQIGLLETHIRFEDNGDSRKEVHTRVHINSELGVRQFSHLSFDFNRTFQQIEIPSVHITHASGGTADILPSAITDQPNPAVVDAPAYQDVRVKSIRILGLAPGDDLEYSVITTTTHHPLAPDFWLEHNFDRTGVVSQEIFELDLPAHSFIPIPGLQAALPTPPNPLSLWSPSDLGQIKISPRTPASSRAQVGEGTASRLIYQWKLTQGDIPKTSANPTSGEPEEPDVVVTTFSSWEHLQRRLQFAVQFSTSTEIFSQALIAVRNASRDATPLETAYYDLVSTKVRTVDLPLDLARLQKRKYSEVLSSGYGTPEDKASLFRVLTSRSRGRSRMLLVASSDSPEKQPPRPSLLTQFLVAMDDGKRTLYFDPSLEVAPFGVIRPDLRGKKALDLGGNCYGADCWKTVSNEPPFPAFQRVKVEAAFGQDGTLNATVRYTMRGDNELLLRLAFHQSPRDKWKDVAQLLALSDGFRGKIISASASDPRVTKQPFTVEYQITQPKFIDWSKKPVHIPALLPLLSLPDPPAKPADGAATLPLDLGTPLDVRTSLILHLPPGVSVQAPSGTSVERDYATFTSSYAAEASVVFASRHIHFILRQIPAARAVDYSAFLHAVQTDQSQIFSLDGPATVPPSIPPNPTPPPNSKP